MIDIPTAATRYAVSPDRLRHWIRMGHLAARREGRFYLVRESEVARLVADPPQAGRPRRENPPDA